MHEALGSLIEAHGYWFVFLGTVVGGETVVAMAGFLAECGYLWLPGVLACASLGALTVDQLWFWTGRVAGQRLLTRWPSWRPPVESILARVARHQIPVMLGFRFMTGLKTLTPFALGMARVPPWRFVLFNVLGTLLWTTVVALAGHGIGLAVQRWLGRARHHEVRVLALIAAAGLLAWAWHFLRSHRRRHERRQEGH